MEAEQVDCDWIRYKCIKTGEILSFYNKTTGEYQCSCIGKNKSKLAKICELLHPSENCKVCGPGSEDLVALIEDAFNQQKSFQFIETKNQNEQAERKKTPLAGVNVGCEEGVKGKSTEETLSCCSLEEVLADSAQSKIDEDRPLISLSVEATVKYDNPEEQNVEYSEMPSDLHNHTETDIESNKQNNTPPTRRLTKRELKKKLKCTFCEKRFAFLSRLNVHLKTHTKERHFKCTYCDKAFVQKSTLVRHTKMHTEEKPFKCEYCDVAYPVERRLKIHLKKHIDFRPFKCLYCEKCFKRRSEYFTHTRTHTGERPFHCTYRRCYKSFKQKGALNSHLIIHTGERPHECMFCDMKFRQEHHLLVHLRRHTGEKPYRCTLCKKSFRHKTTFDDHMRSIVHATIEKDQ